MAFRLALSVLFVTAVFSSGSAMPQYRLIRAAEPAAPKPVVQVVPAPRSALPQYQYQQYKPAPVQVAPVPVFAVPSPAPLAKSGNLVADQQASIVQQTNDYNPADGSYSYGFQSDNGISQQATGSFANGKYIVQGSYTSYTKDGYPISISYTADENGYQAVGDSIPQPDQAIIKAVEYLRSLPPQKDEQ